MLVEFSESFLFIVCLFFSFLYSGSESALLSIPSDRVHQLIEDGDKKGHALKFMVDHPTEILTTILVGNNLVNTFAASLMTIIARRYFGDNLMALTVGITTILILIFGEIIPKTLARNFGEKFAIPIMYFLRVNYFVFYPVIKFLSKIIHLVLGENAKIITRSVTKDDIEFYVQKAEKEKTIDSKQIDLLASILEFPKIKVKDIMVVRNKVKLIEKDSSFKQILDIVREEVHSRFPVCEDGDLDKTIGFLHVKDLVYLERVEHFKIEKYLKNAFFVYEHMKIQSVFDHMKRKKLHMALVKDETGLVVGIITLEDIIEEIVGQIQDEHDDEENEEPKLSSPEEGIVIDATISLRELYNDYEIEIPLSDNYSTVAGFLLEMLGNNFPKKGNIIVAHGFSFELRKVLNNEIKEVKILDVDGEKHIFSKKDAKDNGDE